MKATELRIGNYVSNNGFIPYEINSIDILHCVKFENSFEPIPLTEEWLLNFGFEKEEIDTEDFFEIKYKKQINEDIFINYADDFSCSLYYNEERSGKDIGVLPKWQQINTVHGLQNLHFALTGEELKIK